MLQRQRERERERERERAICSCSIKNGDRNWINKVILGFYGPVNPDSGRRIQELERQRDKDILCFYGPVSPDSGRTDTGTGN